MKFFRKSYFPKLILGLVLAIQFLIVFGLIIFASTMIGVDGHFTEEQLRIILSIIGVVFAIDVVLGVVIVNQSNAEVYRLTWLFFVFCLPILGILLYLFVANKTTEKHRKKYLEAHASPIQKVEQNPEDLKALQQEYPYLETLANYLSNVSKGGIHRHTSVQYFGLVDYAFEPILAELKKAKHYIFLEFFIIGEGKFWGSILEILKQKAQEGVDVRVIYDDVGSLSSIPFGYDKKLEKMGIKAMIYNRFRPIADIRMNNRDHRKIMVIDGHTCFTGGFNVADEYINAEVRFGHWKDNAMMLKGAAVSNFTAMFLANWIIARREDENIDKSYYDASKFIDEIGGFPENDGFVQPYTDIPYDANAVGERVYINICNIAKKYLYVATPYLIIDKEMENALTFAAESGVDVRLLTPHIPDKGTVFSITRSFYGNLLKAGVKVYEYTPGFVHEKVFIADDEVATCGTINLDYRSLYLHMECGTLMVGTKAVVDMKEDFEKTLESCHEVTLPEWQHWNKRNKTYWAVLRLVAPLL